jgi:hypothetical protein
LKFFLLMYFHESNTYAKFHQNPMCPDGEPFLPEGAGPVKKMFFHGFSFHKERRDLRFREVILSNSWNSASFDIRLDTKKVYHRFTIGTTRAKKQRKIISDSRVKVSQERSWKIKMVDAGDHFSIKSTFEPSLQHLAHDSSQN